jgi:hypothetical protein
VDKNKNKLEPELPDPDEYVRGEDEYKEILLARRNHPPFYLAHFWWLIFSVVKPEPQGAETFGWSWSRNVKVSAPAPGSGSGSA